MDTVEKACGALLLLGALTIAGCLDKPEIEQRWTRVDLASSNPDAGQWLPAGSTQTITLATTVTYRSILTGFAVAELRAGDSVAAGLNIDRRAPRLRMAQDIDYLLQHSRSLGRATRAVTGWDHLIQPIDFTFNATLPDSGSASRLFLLCYLGSGERIEVAGGPDSIVITPFVSSEREVLPVGIELRLSGTGTP